MRIVSWDVVDLSRRFGRRLSRRPVLTGILAGLLIGWWIWTTSCALSWRRSNDCFISLPGEHTVVGSVGWGVAAFTVVTGALVIVGRHADRGRTPDRA